MVEAQCVAGHVAKGQKMVLDVSKSPALVRVLCEYLARVQQNYCFAHNETLPANCW